MHVATFSWLAKLLGKQWSRKIIYFGGGGYEFAVRFALAPKYTVHKDNKTIIVQRISSFFRFYEAQLAAAALCIHSLLLLVWLTKMQLHDVSALQHAFACNIINV